MDPGLPVQVVPGLGPGVPSARSRPLGGQLAPKRKGGKGLDHPRQVLLRHSLVTRPLHPAGREGEGGTTRNVLLVVLQQASGVAKKCHTASKYC